MAGDWIKIENTLPDKPEVWQIAEALKIDADAVTGKLIRIWIWASENCNGLGVTNVTAKKLIDRASGVKGFSDAMIAAGWLLENGNEICFPNFDRHCTKTAKERANLNRRVAKHRNGVALQNSENCNGASVTDVTAQPLQKPLPEKEKELKENTKEKPTSFLFPKILDTPEFREAWDKWEAHCAENCKPVKATQRDVVLMKLAREGNAEDAIAAIENSITKKKTVIFPPWPEVKPRETVTEETGDGLAEIAARKAASDRAFAEACAR